jgi:membrane-bound inhibitor of C-type lysozyme
MRVDVKLYFTGNTGVSVSMVEQMADRLASLMTAWRATEFFSMQRHVVFFASVFVLCNLTGCITSDEQENRWAYTCPDGYAFTTIFARDSESVTFEDTAQKSKLDKEQVASGARYVDDNIVFWNKGVMARVEIGEDVVHQDCQGDSS